MALLKYYGLAVLTAFAMPALAYAEVDCSDRQPPAHMTRATECLWEKGGGKPVDYHNDCSTWQGFFHTLNGFPQNSITRQFFQNPDEYLALEFTTDDLRRNSSGRILTAAAQYGAPATFQGGKVIASLSRCPGDFHQEAIVGESEPACYGLGFPMYSTPGYGGTLGPAWGFCELAPNTTYYLNIVFTKSPEGTPPEFLEWACTGGGIEGEQSRCATLVSWKEN